MNAFACLLFAPIVETLLFQALIIGALKWMGMGLGTQVAASAFLFALIHFGESIAVGVAAGIPGGLYYGFTFAFWLQDSFWTAFWVTAVSHFLHNLLPTAMLSGENIERRRQTRMKSRRRTRREKETTLSLNADGFCAPKIPACAGMTI